jgi:hypothetical protein
MKRLTSKAKNAQQVAIVPNLQPACKYRIVALDPSVIGPDGKILMADIQIPNERLADGPRGYRVQVVDYDATSKILYKPAPYRETDNIKVPKNIVKDRAFHARNVYAIVMRVLARFERALGRRVGWSFLGHQLSVAPHAFVDLNAFYSKDDRAILFGYYPGANGTVFTCLSHEVIAHETTHAILDGLRPNYTYPSSPDQAAFHEGFGDIVALLSVLSLREVVSAALDLKIPKSEELINVSRLTESALKGGVLLGMALQVGEAMYGAHGVALRRSIELAPSPSLARSDQYKESHRRGELLAAAVLGAFLKLWKERIDMLGELEKGKVNRLGVVDGAVETADRLLTIVIRALDYCPPTDLLFGDFLSAMLTADYELYPDDSRYGYRKALRDGFASFGFKPSAISPLATAEPGLWSGPGDTPLLYSRTHHESMKYDRDEVFRFIWENRLGLNIDVDAYTKVEAVWPCYRIGSDGFFLRETVAVYSQQMRLEARELTKLNLKKPSQMPDDLQLTLYGGGALIFDESGRLKYHVTKSISNSKQQNLRLEYLWSQGNMNSRKSFAALHLERVVRRDISAAADVQSEENDDYGETAN